MNYNDKYEYIFPELTFNKNLITDDNFGYLDLESNFKVFITMIQIKLKIFDK